MIRCCLLVLLTGLAWAQPTPLTGPLAQNLGDGWWVARTNVYPLTTGDIVGIYRGGQEVGQGRVFRTAEQACTIRVFGVSELIQGDMVGRVKALEGGFGPEIPSRLLTPQSQSPAYTGSPSYKQQWHPSLPPGRSPTTPSHGQTY